MELHETEVEIKVGGVARTVTAASYLSLDETHAIHVPGVVAVIGRGVARYPAQVMLHRRQPGSPQPRGTELVVDSEGREWTYHLDTCVRNRQARIVAWDDVEQVTNNADQSRPVEKPAPPAAVDQVDEVVVASVPGPVVRDERSVAEVLADLGPDETPEPAAPRSCVVCGDQGGPFVKALGAFGAEVDVCASPSQCIDRREQAPPAERVDRSDRSDGAE